ncbi:uncharacterized protein LOC126796335 [Argentina anserina]|uniref:uncharacterized protein LOC126796335 n=1 Tax=Argentina anserina TaxID=57926 RepID=UPI0021768B4E|nr:uncharacterized protein LOC126796335 [Potentilla anserina]
MEDMRKRPGGDVTADDASSSSSSSPSPSLKRRRDQDGEQGADISVANDVVMDGADSSDAPPVNGVAADSVDAISVPPAVNGVVAEIGGNIFPAPAANGVVADSGHISVHPATNGVAEDIGGGPVAPAVNEAVVDNDDVALSELTRLLDSDYPAWNAAATTPETLTFADNPSRSPKVFQTMSTSYVTINGNEESCGSSFSDAESSMMASVDRNGRDVEQARLDYEFYAAMRWAEWYDESGFEDSAWDASAREGMVLNLDLDSEWDDAVLARFIGEDLN